MRLTHEDIDECVRKLRATAPFIPHRVWHDGRFAFAEIEGVGGCCVLPEAVNLMFFPVAVWDSLNPHHSECPLCIA